MPAQNCSCTKPQILVKSANRNIEYLGCYPDANKRYELLVFVIVINIYIMFLVEREDKRNLMLAGQYDHIKKLEIKQISIGKINDLDLFLIQLPLFLVEFQSTITANHSQVISCNEQDDRYEFPVALSGRKIEVQGTD